MSQATTTERREHRSVKTAIPWVGWDYMEGLNDKAIQIFGLKEAALLSILFTGGFRVSEVVRSHHGGLKQANVVPVEKDRMLRFSDVSVMKKYQKIQGSGYACHDTGPHMGRAIWDPDHKHFKTERRAGKEIIRNCSAPLYEPLMQTILQYLDKADEDYLFDFSGNPNGEGNRQKAWRIVEAIDPLTWPHWFRSQRASQLGAKLEKGGYEWNKDQMKKWFKWTSAEIAEVYAHEEESEMDSLFPSRLRA